MCHGLKLACLCKVESGVIPRLLFVCHWYVSGLNFHNKGMMREFNGLGGFTLLWFELIELVLICYFIGCSLDPLCSVLSVLDKQTAGSWYAL